MQHWRKLVLQKTASVLHSIIFKKLSEVSGIAIVNCVSLFQITKYESFQLKLMEEKPPIFTALLLFKAWQNFKCKILLFPKYS